MIACRQKLVKKYDTVVSELCIIIDKLKSEVEIMSGQQKLTNLMLEAMLNEHQPEHGRRVRAIPTCTGCSAVYPCPTVRAAWDAGAAALRANPDAIRHLNPALTQ